MNPVSKAQNVTLQPKKCDIVLTQSLKILFPFQSQLEEPKITIEPCITPLL
jgi:hypothetical protein